MRSGLEFYKTNFTKESVLAKNILVVAKSSKNPLADASFSKTSGIITSRTDGSSYENIRFFKFPAGSTAITVGSRNG